MSTYFPHTQKDIDEMLKACNASSLDDLYADVPKDLFAKKLNIPEGKTEQEILDQFEELASKNVVYKTILKGAGSYHHYIPPVVKALSSKAEFVTAYTPYQAEMSQGILKIFFEYQTMICNLLEMDVSNASVYNGSSAAAEAAIMCIDRKRKKVIVANEIKPDTLKTIKTYVDGHGEVVVLETEDGKVDIQNLEKELSDDTACVYLEQPNYFGSIEDAKKVGDILKEKGIKFVMGVNPIAMAILKTPRECGADIAVGEGQPLGMPLSFGGPYLGFMTCLEKEVRKMPGRIVGKTKDAEGNDAYVLTLQAREQHIRRERALSNICSNQALCALTATIYLAALGKEGLKDVANACVDLSHYFASELKKANVCVVDKGEFFHEFVTITKSRARDVLKALKEENILGGHLLDNDEILWCTTEMVDKKDLDKAVEIIAKFA